MYFDQLYLGSTRNDLGIDQSITIEPLPTPGLNGLLGRRREEHRSKLCRSRVALLRDTTELLQHKTREEGKKQNRIEKKKRKKRREKGKNKIGR
jgi:hypothetical protein